MPIGDYQPGPYMTVPAQPQKSHEEWMEEFRKASMQPMTVLPQPVDHQLRQMRFELMKIHLATVYGVESSIEKSIAIMHFVEHGTMPPPKEPELKPKIV